LQEDYGGIKQLSRVVKLDIWFCETFGWIFCKLFVIKDLWWFLDEFEKSVKRSKTFKNIQKRAKTYKNYMQTFKN
jgi:hypothetical protein